jgi:hypothetical protein
LDGGVPFINSSEMKTCLRGVKSGIDGVELGEQATPRRAERPRLHEDLELQKEIGDDGAAVGVGTGTTANRMMRPVSTL